MKELIERLEAERKEARRLARMFGDGGHHTAEARQQGIAEGIGRAVSMILDEAIAGGTWKVVGKGKGGKA